MVGSESERMPKHARYSKEFLEHHFQIFTSEIILLESVTCSNTVLLELYNAIAANPVRIAPQLGVGVGRSPANRVSPANLLRVTCVLIL